MKTGLAAFKFALVGFALPYAFVLHPELLLLSSDVVDIGGNILVAAIGIIPLAAAIAGFGLGPLRQWERWVLLAAALVLFLTPSGENRIVVQGIAIVVVVWIGLKGALGRAG